MRKNKWRCVIWVMLGCMLFLSSRAMAIAQVNLNNHRNVPPVTLMPEPSEVKAVSETDVNDPYEPFNRAMFTFNDKLDVYFLKPVATVYNAIIPKPLNQGIHNFFNNLNELPTIANDILQLHFYQMTNDMWRFGVNTTIGIGGLFDVATRIGLKPYNNDFGLTLANWGWRQSNYLVLPLLGSNTWRDIIEVPVDNYAFSIYPYIRSSAISYGLYGLGVVDRRAQLLQYQPVFEEAAIDQYVFIRNAFMQRRAFQIYENQHLSISLHMNVRCLESGYNSDCHSAGSGEGAEGAYIADGNQPVTADGQVAQTDTEMTTKTEEQASVDNSNTTMHSDTATSSQ